MLAKVLKNQSAIALTPFVIPVHGTSSNFSEGVSGFAFPAPIDFIPSLKTENALDVQPPNEHLNHNVYEDILETAKREAEALIAKAEAHSQTIEQAATEKGLQKANQTIAEEVDAKAAELRQQLTETIAAVSGLRQEVMAQTENDMVRLALEIARKIIGREVAIDREIAITLARVALGRINNRTAAAVHLSPEDFVYVSNHQQKLEFYGALELIEDRSIQPGGCLVRTNAGDIDARIEAQFEEISNGLLS